MVLNPRQRQKKTERRNAKQKARRKDLVPHQKGSLTAQLSDAARNPIVHCCANSTLWEQGIGYVLLSRSIGSGSVAFAAFLVDVYCLGVKDVMFDISTRRQYELQIYDKLMGQHLVTKLKPECARKLVEGAVDFAHDAGLYPHPDYHKGKTLFGDIDATACGERFEFGQDGKPFFVAGPYDNPGRCQQILRLLTERYGEDGFHCLLPVHPIN